MLFNILIYLLMLFFWLLNLTNIPDTSLDPKKIVTRSSDHFTHPIIPRLLQDHEIMSMRRYVLYVAYVAFHHIYHP